MSRISRYKTDLIIVVGFFVLPLLLFGSVTLGGRTMLPVDNLFQWAPWTAVADEMGVGVPQNGLLTDLIIENYAWRSFFVDSIRAGEIPLWNPNLFAGAPFLATGQHSMLYPFSWLFLILPIPLAYGWYTVIQIWLAGVLMYLFGRVLNMRPGSAAIAGIIYQGCGFLLVSAAVFPMVLGAAVWLPLLLACIEKIIQTTAQRKPTTLLWAAAGAVALGLQILAGHIEITYYTLLVMALYAAYRLISDAVGGRHEKKIWQGLLGLLRSRSAQAFAWLLGMVLIGLLLGGVQLIPFYEVGQVNFREGSASFAEVRGWAFPARRVLTLALPNFFGNPAHHAYLDVFTRETVPFGLNTYGELNPQGAYTSDWGIKNYVEGGIYLGILPLFLALVGIWGLWRDESDRLRRRQGAFFLVLSFFSLAFIFGTPLYGLLFYGLPFINQLHTPFRWVWPLALCVAVLAGFGVDFVNRGLVLSNTEVEVEKRREVFVKALAAIALLGGAGILLLLVGSWLVFEQVEPLVERLFLALALAPTAFASARAFYSYQFWQMLILGVMLVASAVTLWLFMRAKRPWLPVVVAISLIILDLFLANRGFHAVNDPALLEYKPEMVAWLEAQPGEWRLTSFTPHGDKPFNANSGWLYGFHDIRGYDSIIPKQYTDYMAAIESQNGLPFNRVQPIANWESLNSPLLDVLNVKYIISSEEIDLPKLQTVWQGEGVYIYENLAAAPRAYTLPKSAAAVTGDPLTTMQTLDPRQHVIIATQDAPTIPHSALPGTGEPANSQSYAPATISEYRNIQVIVDTAVTEPAWLILNDSYFPGWKAYVRPQGSAEADEQQIPITRVNGNFRGVELEPGEWTVRFRYSPASFQLGGLASAMALIILMFGTAVWGWQRLYNPQGTLSTTHSIAKNSALPMALNLFNRAIDFVFAMYYLRILGPADAGRYVTAITTAMIFEILSNYGLDILLIREVSQDRRKANHYLFNTTLLRLGAAVVASLPVLAFMWVSSLSENPLTPAELAAIILIMIGMVFSGMSKGVTGMFYVYEEAEIPAAMTTGTTIMKVGLGVIVLLLGYSFVGLAAVSIIVNIITLAILLFLALRRFDLKGPWRFDWPMQRSLIRMGFPLMLIHLLQTVFISIDILLLRLMLDNGEEVVGWYQNAYKWFNALQIIPSFFTLALFAIISREIKRSIDAARRMYMLSLKLMLLLALPIAAFTTFLAYFLVRLLAGPEYLPHGAIALQLVIWSIPFGWLNSVTNYVLIALGLEGMQPRAFTIAVGFNIIANLIFIPRFSYVAASVTTILSEVVLMLVFAYYLRRRMSGVNWFDLMWKPFLVTAVMVAAMWAGNQIHLLLALILGTIIYPAGLLLLHVIGPEERKVLAAILPAKIATRLKLT